LIIVFSISRAHHNHKQLTFINIFEKTLIHLNINLTCVF